MLVSEGESFQRKLLQIQCFLQFATDLEKLARVLLMTDHDQAGVESYEVELIGESGLKTTGLFQAIDDTEHRCRLILDCSLGRFTAVESDYFECLARIREQLEPLGVTPLCYGASRRVFPSGMARDMGYGLKAYKLELRRHGRTADLVEIFDSGPDIETATVREQEEFYQQWLSSLKSS